MLAYVWLFVGISIILLVFYDFAVTVFIPKGAGFLTESLNLSVAKAFKILARHRGDNPLLDYTPLAIVITMAISWVSLVWIGTTLIFHFEPASVIHSQTKLPASFAEKLYFTGYTLSTLGTGDFLPNGSIWQIYSAVASFMGFILLTVCITYIVPVINNILEKNTLSLRIASLGESSHSILFNAYNGDNLNSLCNQLSSLASDIFRYAKNHLAYPILHHVHNSDKAENAILKLVSLDEAITLLLYHIPDEKCTQRIDLQQVRRSITSYIQSNKHVQPSDTPPPLPNFQRISQTLGTSLLNISSPERDKLYGELTERRRWLKGIVEDDGWTWEDLEGGKFKNALDVNYNDWHSQQTPQ